MVQSWCGIEDEGLWAILPDEMSLLPSRPDKGRLGGRVARGNLTLRLLDHLWKKISAAGLVCSVAE
jgi:hypothetical protein